MKKLLPIGIQTYSEIRENNYIYVDKTRLIHELITTGKTYFLSRPRRFGKSLLISTLEAIFKREKKLFQGLDIERMDYDWQTYPIVRIDFSSLNKDNSEELKKDLSLTLEGIAKEYHITLAKHLHPTSYFKLLLQKLSKINRVVILIDEYDAPIIKHIANNVELAAQNREFLKEFYTVIKGQDQYLKFVFLTGVSKFSKVGVFSGLNNLKDITMDSRFSDLLGWTQKELEENFKNYIDALAQEEELSVEKTTQKIKHWYNGYRFSVKNLYVYNPFSTLLLLDKKFFDFHWFETGTPTFLIELMKKQGTFSLKEMLDNKLSAEAFSSYEIEQLDPLPLLLQTGYLTIKEYDKETRLYTLGYPNFEVNNAFTERLIKTFSCLEPGMAEGYIVKLIRSLQSNDLENFFETLRIFFANIPYTIQLKQEKYYQTIFYLIFSLLGLRIRAEVTTNRGRIDAVVELKKSVYIFEFKLFGTHQEALAQIKKKRYYEKYLDSGKKITLVGAAFDPEERNIGEHTEETADCDQKDKPQ